MENIVNYGIMEIQEAIQLLERNGYEIIPPQSVISIDNEFERWWELYNKKRGKDRCLRKWHHMSKKDRIACINATPRYVASVSSKVYQKDPLTYLNGRSWEDEIYTEYDDEQKSELNFASKAAAIFGAD